MTGQHWARLCIPLLQVTVLSLLQDVDTAFLVKADLETNLEALEHEIEFLKALFEEVLKATRSFSWPVRPAPWEQGGQEEPRQVLDTRHMRPGSETPQDLLSRSLVVGSPLEKFWVTTGTRTRNRLGTVGWEEQEQVLGGHSKLLS